VLWQLYLDLDSATTEQELNAAAASLSKVLAGPIADGLLKVLMVGAGKGAGKVAGEFHKRYQFQLPNGIKNGSRLNSGVPRPKIVDRTKLQKRIAPSRGWKSSNLGDTSKNAALLRKNLGDALKKGEDAHHIVQSTHPRAEVARKLLDKYQIDINDAANGVGLKPSGPKPAHHGHGLHSHDAIDRVTDRLNRAVDGVSDWASGRQALLDALAKLNFEIAGRQFP
jgi:A nuclease family of the HNH/ENDO VII superfamily with conserved AHH